MPFGYSVYDKEYEKISMLIYFNESFAALRA